MVHSFKHFIVREISSMVYIQKFDWLVISTIAKLLVYKLAVFTNNIEMYADGKYLEISEEQSGHHLKR